MIDRTSHDRATGTSNRGEDPPHTRCPGRNQPFFVVGAHRSGTTLLRFMLTGHPRLYVPPESEFIPAFFGGSPARRLSSARCRRILDKVFRLRFVGEWSGPPPDIDDLVPDGQPVTPARLVDGLYTAYARQHGAARWGDKTPTYTGHIDLLHRLFPDAQFIHLIRDGRDVALSVLDTWGHRAHVDLVFAARTWRRRVTQARRSTAGLDPAHALELRYEDLVVEPEQRLRRVCQFLGEEFDPRMLDFHLDAARSLPEGGFHEPVRRPLTSRRVERWRHEMSERDLRLFEAVAGPTLEAVGYETSGRHALTASDRARILVPSARYLAYRTARRALELTGLRMPN
jgi:hypothetical protein